MSKNKPHIDDNVHVKKLLKEIKIYRMKIASTVN